jgi:hypothetical protein
MPVPEAMKVGGNEMKVLLSLTGSVPAGVVGSGCSQGIGIYLATSGAVTNAGNG